MKCRTRISRTGKKENAAYKIIKKSEKAQPCQVPDFGELRDLLRESIYYHDMLIKTCLHLGAKEIPEKILALHSRIEKFMKKIEES